MDTAERDQLVVPTDSGWALTHAGMARHGVHALDFCAGLDASGQLVVCAPGGDTGTCIADEPEDWTGTWPEWCLASLATDGWDLADADTEVLNELLLDLQPTHSEAAGSVLEEAFPGLTPELRALMYQLSGYLYLTDIDQVLATLAAGVAQSVPGDPLWLMLVSVSSSGKGESLRLLDHVAEARLKDITLPGLLSRSRGKNSRTIGLLTKLQDADALLTITDFSALLGDNKRSGDTKADLFNALRDIYDGEYSRTMDGGTAYWSGRISFVAACTPAIDRFTAHADSLGTRWLYYRQPQQDAEVRQRKAEMAFRRANLADKRAQAASLAGEIVQRARANAASVSMPYEFEQVLTSAAVLVGYGRASVPRDWRGQIEDVVHSEDPSRLASQLKLLATGLLALGVAEEVALRVTRHAALSSMPVARAEVLKTMAASIDSTISAYRIAKETGMHPNTVAKALEDWETIGFAEKLNVEGGTASGDWKLTNEHLETVRKVLS